MSLRCTLLPSSTTVASTSSTPPFYHIYGPVSILDKVFILSRLYLFLNLVEDSFPGRVQEPAVGE